MAKKKVYLTDFTIGKVVGHTYSEDNAARLVLMNPGWNQQPPGAEVKCPYLGKVSTLNALRWLFTDGYFDQLDQPGYTMGELQEHIAGASETSIITALSDLKNDLYAAGNTVRVKKVNGFYVRQ